MAEVAQLKETRARARGGGARGERRRSTRRSAEIPNLPTRTCRSARTSTATSRSAASATRATSTAPKEHFELGEALRPDGFRDRREALRLALRGAEEASSRGSSARSASSCSTCTRPSTATRRCAAAAGARRSDVRDGAAAEVRRGSVQLAFAESATRESSAASDSGRVLEMPTEDRHVAALDDLNRCRAASIASSCAGCRITSGSSPPPKSR